MKIVVINTTVMASPPTGYSGLEMIAYLQARELGKLGHQVLFVSPVGSDEPKNVELHGTTVREPEAKAYYGYRERLKEYDVVIDNSWEKWAYLEKINHDLKVPVLGVLHAPPHTMYKTPPPVDLPCLVAISKDQRKAASEAWGVPSRVAYNGIDVDSYPMNGEDRSNRYLFLGRMSRIKGAHIAVDLARRCRFGLDLVGDDKLTGEPAYAHRLMRLATNGIKYHGGVSRDSTVAFFQKGKALLHMNQIYREPFGMAPVEAQLCGMPVITFDNGAMRETVNDKKTGFIVSDIDEVEGLVNLDAVSEIRPSDCREWASQFSAEAMGKRYEELCKEAIETGGW